MALALSAHPDAAAFLAAIVERPTDDAVRLIFADWLTENGEPERAEFVRVQIELARLKHPGEHYHWNGRKDCDGCRAKPLRARERELWNLPLIFRELPDTSEVELPPLVLAPGGGQNELVVRRGFIATARLTCAAFLGGPCGRCGGLGCTACGGPTASGRICRDADRCPDCAGSGRTPGLAAALARHPVEAVQLVDAEPYRRVDGKYGWGNEDDEGGLPAVLWDRLEPRGDRRCYPTAENAHAALSAACVAHLAALRV